MTRSKSFESFKVSTITLTRSFSLTHTTTMSDGWGWSKREQASRSFEMGGGGGCLSVYLFVCLPCCPLYSTCTTFTNTHFLLALCRCCILEELCAGARMRVHVPPQPLVNDKCCEIAALARCIECMGASSKRLPLCYVTRVHCDKCSVY
jgi:hypothetical protein